MTIPVVDADVKALIDTNRDTTPFITTATLLVTEDLASQAFSDQRYFEITKYLAAHFCCITEELGGLTYSRMGDAIEKYRDPPTKNDFGLGTTRFGKMAMSLDSSGTLAALTANDGLKARLSVIKYPRVWPSTADLGWGDFGLGW